MKLRTHSAYRPGHIAKSELPPLAAFHTIKCDDCAEEFRGAGNSTRCPKCQAKHKDANASTVHKLFRRGISRRKLRRAA